MARAKNRKSGGESGLERWLGTALTSFVLAKVALKDHDSNGAANSTGAVVTDGSRHLRLAGEAGDHGRMATQPGDIPKRGWKDVAWRVNKEAKQDGVPLLAAGVTYYAMLALFPALLAVVSIYGLVASPSEVAAQMSSLTRAMPGEARQLIITQLTAVAEKPDSGLGITAIVAILASLWSASSGMRWTMAALSRAYDEEDDRKFIKMRGTAVLLTVGAAVVAVVALSLLVALPSVFRAFGLGPAGKVVVSVFRWPLLAALVIVGLSTLYRYGPNRDKPQWRWVTWGSVIAAAIWLLASVGFTAYTSLFGKFDQTYGALGAVIVLMLWLWLSSYAVLLGAEINCELEKQTVRDTTVGPDKPMGSREATAADELGPAKPAKAG